MTNQTMTVQVKTSPSPEQLHRFVRWAGKQGEEGKCAPFWIAKFCKKHGINPLDVHLEMDFQPNFLNQVEVEFRKLTEEVQ